MFRDSFNGCKGIVRDVSGIRRSGRAITTVVATDPTQTPSHSALHVID